MVGAWQSAKYAFTPGFTKIVEQALVSYAKRELPHKALPPWRDYVKTDPAAAATVPNHGHIGLRLSTYGDKVQTATDLRGHHTTQYLLVEYFSNKKTDKKPFKSKFPYEGLKWSGGVPETLQRPPGSKASSDAQLSPLLPSRGKQMPSISLAASTHERGGVHITASSDEEDTSATQSGTVHERFEHFLGDPLKKADAQAKAYVAKKPAEAHKDLYDAVMLTYRDMRKKMHTSLKDSLPVFEFGYYSDISEQKKPDPLEQQGEEAKFKAALRKVADAAYDHPALGNNAVMNTLGWK
jgi:hypothetical protein